MRNSVGQSHLRFPLTRIFASGGNVRVLRALTAYGAPLSATQLAQDTGLTPQGVRLILDALVAQGLVGVLGQPRSQLFSMVMEHPLAGAIAALFEQERSRWDGLLQALRDTLQAHKEVRSAWLYGSVARGEDAPHSDIDIAMVITEPGTPVKAREALQVLGDHLLVHFSVVALSPTEMARLPAKDRWWAEMARDAKVLNGMGPQQEAARCLHKGRQA